MTRERGRTRTVWLSGLACVAALSLVWREHPSDASPAVTNALVVSETLAGGPATANPAHVLGLESGKCAQCHPSEVDTWKLTTHSNSRSKIAKFEGNTAKYATALGITADNIDQSVCADCHATKSGAEGAEKVISGVSCESCHGGAKEWKDLHWQYTAGLQFKNLETLRADRLKESEADREKRLAACDKAGQIRAAEISELARNCFSCHVVSNEKLIAAGHKATSAFELVSWSSGEIRHNFFMDPKTNAEAPSLWMAVTGGKPEQRKRVKFVVGPLVQIEMLLRARAEATNPAVIPGIAAGILAGNGKLAQINGVAGTDESKAAAAAIAPTIARLFAPMPDDKKFYSELADKIGEQADSFVKNNDGSGLAGLDALIKATPPYYSQYYKDQTK